MLAATHAHVGHQTGDRSRKGDLHLHRLEQAECLSGADAVARADVHRHDHGRRAGAHHAGGVPPEAQRSTLDLEPHAGGAGIVEHAQLAIADLQARRVAAGFAQCHGGGLLAELDAVAPRADGEDFGAIGLAAIRQRDLLPVRLRDAREHHRRRVGEEVQPCRRTRPLVRQDRRGDQPFDGVGVAGRARRGEAIEPAGVDGAGAKGRIGQDVEQEARVGGSTLHHQLEIGERAGQAGARVLARIAARDHLGDQRIECRRNDAAGDDAAVDADARSEGRIEARDTAGGGLEPGIGVIGTQARFDRPTALFDRQPGQALAARDADLQLDQVETGDGLGDGVLDLQARIDLEEEVRLAGDEKLHGTHADVADGAGQADGALLQGAPQRRRQSGRRRLFDQLLVAALHRAVAAAERVHLAVLVGDDLYLDVTAALHLALEEETTVAKGRFGFGAGGAQCVGQRGRIRHDADTAAAAASGRLDHQRIADPFGARRGRIADLAVAPGRDRDAERLGQPLGFDLVAEPAHRRRRRAEEDDPGRRQALDELGVFGDEAPAGPHRVRSAAPQRLEHALVVEVGRHLVRRRAQRHGAVGMAHEGRVALRRGIERQGAQIGAFRSPQCLHRADAAHGRLAAVDDREAVKGAAHRAPRWHAKATKRP